MKTITKTIITSVNVATVEDFAEFLENQGKLYKFMKNCSKVRLVGCLEDKRVTPFVAEKNPLRDFIEFLHYNEDLLHRVYGGNWYSNLIKASFRWVASEEGEEFWSRTDKDWRNWLGENKIEDFEI